jgi:nitrogen fixation/metabolism regulation signal transduction histidine kinase
LAWGEVARRLAHEIKNPLTPIQLSAQRLERRLSGKLADSDEAVLRKSVNTIVNQVDAMKNLVNEFREYARLPVAQLVRQDLNALVQEICHIYDEEQAGANLDRLGPRTGIQLQLDATCPPIAVDAGQLRQVIHNLLQNAQDACGYDAPANIWVTTQWQEAGGRVRLSVLDSGPGFADNVLSRAAEPYVTTKASGTGLGLAVVKKIAEEHFAKLEVSNRVQGGEIIGAQVSLVFFVSTLANFASHQGALPSVEPTGQVDI